MMIGDENGNSPQSDEKKPEKTSGSAPLNTSAKLSKGKEPVVHEEANEASSEPPMASGEGESTSELDFDALETRKQGGRVKLEDLPEELQIHILNFLPAEDAGRVAGLNRHFRHLSGDSTLWKNISLRDFTGSKLRDFTGSKLELFLAYGNLHTSLPDEKKDDLTFSYSQIYVELTNMSDADAKSIVDLLNQYALNKKIKHLNSALIKAASLGALFVCKLFHQMGADLGTQDEKNNTPFHHAAYRGHLNIVKWLVAKGTSVPSLLKALEEKAKLTPEELFCELARHFCCYMESGAYFSSRSVHQAGHVTEEDITNRLVVSSESVVLKKLPAGIAHALMTCIRRHFYNGREGTCDETWGIPPIEYSVQWSRECSFAEPDFADIHFSLKALYSLYFTIKASDSAIEACEEQNAGQSIKLSLIDARLTLHHILFAGQSAQRDEDLSKPERLSIEIKRECGLVCEIQNGDSEEIIANGIVFSSKQAAEKFAALYPNYGSTRFNTFNLHHDKICKFLDLYGLGGLAEDEDEGQIVSDINRYIQEILILIIWRQIEISPAAMVRVLLLALSLQIVQKHGHDFHCAIEGGYSGNRFRIKFLDKQTADKFAEIYGSYGSHSKPCEFTLHTSVEISEFIERFRTVELPPLVTQQSPTTPQSSFSFFNRPNATLSLGESRDTCVELPCLCS